MVDFFGKRNRAQTADSIFFTSETYFGKFQLPRKFQKTGNLRRSQARPPNTWEDSQLEPALPRKVPAFQAQSIQESSNIYWALCQKHTCFLPVLARLCAEVRTTTEWDSYIPMPFFAGYFSNMPQRLIFYWPKAVWMSSLTCFHSYRRPIKLLIKAEHLPRPV